MPLKLRLRLAKLDVDRLLYRGRVVLVIGGGGGSSRMNSGSVSSASGSSFNIRCTAGGTASRMNSGSDSNVSGSFSLPLSCILEGSLDGVGVSLEGGETVGAGWPKLSTATGCERVFPLDDGSLGRTASGVAVGLVDEFEA